MFADQTTIPLIALYRTGTDPAVTFTDGRITAGILWLDTSTGVTGTLKKRNEANSGWDTLINLDGAALADGSVTLAKLANLAQGLIIGRAAGAGTGVPVGLTASQVKAILALVPGDITGFDTQVRTSRLDQMAAPTADVSLNSHKLTNVTDPGSAQDAATKAYVDSAVSGGAVTDEHIQDVVGALLADGDVDFSYDDAGNTETNVVRKASENFSLPGDISPSQITANQNDYNPTGLSTASTLRLNSDASRNITGLQGGADGRIIVIHNVGSFAIVLKDDDGSTSTAGNRFALNADVTLSSDECAILQYDSSSSRWRIIGGTRPALGTGVATFLATPTSANLAAALTDETGSGAAVFATSPTLVTPVLGTPTSGNLSNCTADGTNGVGFKNIPQNSQSAAYTTVLGDAGKHILHPSTDANARTFTIDSNANVAYPIGTAITFINMTSQVVTIAITTDTMYLAGTGTTGSRSLAQYGVATAIKIDSTHWIISGTGLT